MAGKVIKKGFLEELAPGVGQEWEMPYEQDFSGPIWSLREHQFGFGGWD